MAKKASIYSRQLEEWVAHLYARRESVLNIWRTNCQADPKLTSRSSFSREEFSDQMPVLLNIFSQRLLGEKPEADSIERAGQHGLHRWQRGYSLPELLVELDHLYKVLLDDLHLYVELHPDLHPDLISLAYRELYQISSDSYKGSAIYYDRLRETNAAEQVGSLQQALDQVDELRQKRGEHLSETAYDLQSGFSALTGATMLLKMPSTEKDRTELFGLLNRNLTSLRDMLMQLTDFARLEANQEKVETKSFDAAVLLSDLVANARPIAEARKLELKADGPAHLPVKGDRLKVKRIVQNLLLNALTYTTAGSIYVSWAEENDTRWILSVQDTGPGLTTGPAALLAEQLRPLAEQASAHQAGGPEEYPSQEVPTTKSQKKQSSSDSQPGEGLRLFIVKKFCELLKASMDIETSSGQGTLIRIRFLTDQSQR